MVFFIVKQSEFYMIVGIITPYIRILDFDWLIYSWCIFRVFSYYWLISSIFTYLPDDLTFFPMCVVFAKTYFTFLPSCFSNRQINSEYFFLTFIRKVWLIKFETRKCSDVKDFLNFFPSVSWYLRKRISLFYSRVHQTAKFIRNTSTTVWHNKSKYYHCTCRREQFKASYSI
jgi:hypothetical protein